MRARSACASVRKAAKEQRDIVHCHGASTTFGSSHSFVLGSSACGNAMAARPMKQVSIADEAYNEWLQEVKALKPRKQKNWQTWYATSTA